MNIEYINNEPLYGSFLGRGVIPSTKASCWLATKESVVLTIYQLKENNILIIGEAHILLNTTEYIKNYLNATFTFEELGLRYIQKKKESIYFKITDVDLTTLKKCLEQLPGAVCEWNAL